MTSAIHPESPTAFHGPNLARGRDLVAGGVHGEFATLEFALETLEFQPAKDRLFTLGNLIGRGPRSTDALEWLEGGRFAGGVRGNHEQMLVRTLAGCPKGGDGRWPGQEWWHTDAPEDWHELEAAGGDDPALAERWLAALSQLPYVATIAYEDRRIGLAHSAGIVNSWYGWLDLNHEVDEACRQAAPGEEQRSDDIVCSLLRSRAIILLEDRNDPRVPDRDGDPMEDCDLVISAHQPGLRPRWTRRNVVTIDTGVHEDAFGHLTVAEVQDGLSFHTFERTERCR